MNEGEQFVVEMNEFIWNSFKQALQDVDPEEADWRPLPQANSINLILRHVRIEAEWHVDCLERGVPMPDQLTPALQQQIDSVRVGFEGNFKELEELYGRLLAALQRTTLAGLRAHTSAAYSGPWTESANRVPAHFLGYHHAIHVAGHEAQIRTIRNLYRKTRGEPGMFWPNNPTYPAPAGAKS